VEPADGGDALRAPLIVPRKRVEDAPLIVPRKRVEDAPLNVPREESNGRAP